MSEARSRPRRMMSLVVVATALVVAGAAVVTLRPAGGAPAGPPEAIVEGFVQALAQHSYDRALPYLSDHLLAQTIPLTLEVRVNDLERRTGALRNVDGVPQCSVGTRAYAAAEADTERGGHIRLGFGLVRQDAGRWRIEELYDLGWKPKGVQ